MLQVPSRYQPGVPIKFEAGLGFCSYVTADANGEPQLAEYEPPHKGSIPLLPWLRVRGYAAALRGGFINQLVFFGPEPELLAYRRETVKLFPGADNRIVCYETDATTQSNAAVMKEFLEKNNIAIEDIVAISSSYHLNRAEVFAKLLAGLMADVRFPAEAFWIAETKKNTQEREERLMDLVAAYDGRRPNQWPPHPAEVAYIAHRMVEEDTGHADILRGEYEPR